MSKPDGKLLAKEIMSISMGVVNKHPEIGATCFIALNKEDNYVNCIPCVTSANDLLNLAEQMRIAANRLTLVAKKMNQQQPNSTVH